MIEWDKILHSVYGIPERILKHSDKPIHCKGITYLVEYYYLFSGRQAELMESPSWWEVNGWGRRLTPEWTLTNREGDNPKGILDHHQETHPKKLYTNVYSAYLHNKQTLETTQMIINWLNSDTTLQWISFNNKRKCNPDKYNNMIDFQVLYVRWNKSNKKG